MRYQYVFFKESSSIQKNMVLSPAGPNKDNKFCQNFTQGKIILLTWNEVPGLLFVMLSRFNPSQKLSTTLLLAHSHPPQWDGEENERKSKTDALR